MKKLSDGFGQYRITIKCRRCGHARSSLPDALAALFSWETTFEEISRRMRCSQCEARGECSISTEMLRKPRRHNTHP
jgi:rubredoxin